MFRLLVMVTVLPVVLTTDMFIIPIHHPELMWVSPRVSDNKLLQVPLDDKFPSVCLTNIENVIYYGAISIGTPQQKFKVIFDTASIHLRIRFIESENPFGLPRSQYDIRNMSKQYIPNNPSFHLRFLDCNVTGFQFTNTESMEHMTIYDLYSNIPNQEYAVFGLDYRRLDGMKSVFDNMIQQGLVSSRIFSLYLNRNISADLGGKLIFGGSDPAYYEGNFTYIPVSDKGQWQLKIDSIEVKDVMSYNFIPCDLNSAAIIQTSVWRIKGPEKDISIINRRIGTNSDGNLNCSRIPHLPTITFNMGGKAFDLTGEDYLIRHPDDERICATVFSKINTNVYFRIRWMLGMPFIGRYYTEFDMEKDRVGFALAKKSRIYQNV